MLGVAAIVAVAASRGDAPEPVVGVSPRPAAMPERAPASDADSALREAALARFKNGSAGLRLNDGTRIAPRDAEHEAHIKVNLFKKVLARELAQKDPTFVQVAEQSLRRKRPAELVVEWDELTVALYPIQRKLLFSFRISLPIPAYDPNSGSDETERMEEVDVTPVREPQEGLRCQHEQGCQYE